MEASCESCGSVYRGKALGGLDVDRWERRGEVLHELRWCLCQRDRKGRDVTKGAVEIAHPELAANVVLMSPPYGRADTIGTIERATPKTWVGKHGEKYRREDGWPLGAGYSGTNIVRTELPRLEAWAASQTKETTR